MADPALLQKLAAMLSNTQYEGASFGAGPAWGSVSQNAPLSEAPASGAIEPTTYSGMFGLSPSLGDVGGVPVNATAMMRGTTAPNPQGGGSVSTLTPSAGLGLGPLSVNAGLAHTFSPDGNTIRPEFGASLRGSLLGGNASLSGTLSPNDYKALSAAYTKQLDPQSDLALMLNHTMPQEGKPDTRFGISYRRRF